MPSVLSVAPAVCDTGFTALENMTSFDFMFKNNYLFQSILGAQYIFRKRDE